MLRITTLMDNSGSENKALINEHGLSYLVETPDMRFLFDCSAGKNFMYNAHKLGIALESLDAVVLSHNHYDHAAGFRDFIEAGFSCPVLYTGKNFFEKKYASSDMLKFCDLSSGFDEEFLKAHKILHKECSGVSKIGEGVYIVGAFKRKYDFESIPERFVKMTAKGIVRDDFSDEASCVLETEKGLILLVGCSHPGILNITETVREAFNKPIYAVYGGTHLVEADDRRIEETINRLHEAGVHILGLSHCSGERAGVLLQKNPKVRGCHLSVGDIVTV